MFHLQLEHIAFIGYDLALNYKGITFHYPVQLS